MSEFMSKGFTLIELMITLAIVVILLVIGIPSLTALMIKSQLSGEVQEFYGAIDFARSEAVKRGTSVSICKSADGSTCGGNWSNGWIIFTDENSNGTRDNIGATNEETLLRVFPALPTNYTLNANNNFVNRVTYDRFGMANQPGTFVFCKSSDKTTARAITITITRPRIDTDTNGNGIPEKSETNLVDINSCENP